MNLGSQGKGTWLGRKLKGQVQGKTGSKVEEDIQVSREKLTGLGRGMGTEDLTPPMPSRPGRTLGSAFPPGFLPVERLPEFLWEDRAVSGPWPFPGQDGERGKSPPSCLVLRPPPCPCLNPTGSLGVALSHHLTA